MSHIAVFFWGEKLFLQNKTDMVEQWVWNKASYTYICYWMGLSRWCFNFAQKTIFDSKITTFRPYEMVNFSQHVSNFEIKYTKTNFHSKLTTWPYRLHRCQVYLLVWLETSLSENTFCAYFSDTISYAI